MKAAEEIGTLCRVAAARMPTKWGMFNAAAFVRPAANGIAQIDTALALIMGDLKGEVPLLRIHSQCFTGEGEPVLAAVSAHEEGKNQPRAEPSTPPRHGSDKRPARVGGSEPTRVALDLNSINRRTDYVNH